MAQSNFVFRLAKKECLRSVKNHPRYHLRMVAIGSAALGLFFNTLAIAICKVKLLHGLAFLPVGTLKFHQSSRLKNLVNINGWKAHYLHDLAPR